MKETLFKQWLGGRERGRRGQKKEEWEDRRSFFLYINNSTKKRGSCLFLFFLVLSNFEIEILRLLLFKHVSNPVEREKKRKKREVKISSSRTRHLIKPGNNSFRLFAEFAQLMIMKMQKKQQKQVREYRASNSWVCEIKLGSQKAGAYLKNKGRVK